jgi:parvulin-like peptidyl-prolyl isomerase
LLNAKATAADKATGKEQVAKRMAEIKTKAGSDENLERQLKSVGLTRDELQMRMTDEATAEAVLKRSVKADVKDEDVKKYYEEHTAKFEQPELAYAAHILFLTQDQSGSPLPDDQKAEKKKKAEETLKRAKAGEDFGKLAKELSEDPGSKDNGGEYTFPKGQMVPAFEEKAFSMKPNEISDIVETQFGYHIIKLIGKMPAETAKLDDEVAFPPPPARYIAIKKSWKGPADAVEGAAKLSTMIKEKLEADQMQTQAPEFLAKLEKEAKVEILDEKLKPAPEPPIDMSAPKSMPDSDAPPKSGTAPKPGAK